MAYQRCISLPVLFVLGTICFVYYTIVFLVIDPWLSLLTVPGVLNAAAFTLWAAMCLSCYWRAVARDPGRVAAQYLPDVEAEEAAIQEVKRKGGDARYCQKCRHYKPPRAHHCRVCKRCVLRMDHHCVWINNCVGYENYKPFFLFVLYICTALLHAIVLLAGQAWSELTFGAGGLEPRTEPPLVRRHVSLLAADSNSAVSASLRICCAIVTVPLLIALGVLLAWHLYLLSCNKTTIEYHEGVRAKWLAAKAGEEYKHPYDLGWERNAVQLLGPVGVCWLCPTSGDQSGDGTRFETAYDRFLEKNSAAVQGEGQLRVKSERDVYVTRRIRIPC